MSVWRNLDKTWFANHGATQPEQAANLWEECVSADLGDDFATKKSLLKKLLKLTDPKISNQVLNHMTNDRTGHAGKGRRERTILVVKSLIERVPVVDNADSVFLDVLLSQLLNPRRGHKRVNRVAVFTELQHPPSDIFHYQVITSLHKRAYDNNMLVAVCPLSANSPIYDVERTLREFRPSSVIFIRITPSKPMLRCLQSVVSSHNIAVGLIHADLGDYPQPVVVNVVPDHANFQTSLQAWFRHTANGSSGEAGKPVLVSMQEEPGRSIRNERIREARKVVEDEYGGVLVFVQDYSYTRAEDVFRDYPDASSYVCLSDQIAIALKHLLIGAGKWRNQVVGFDNSILAKEGNIASFDQGLQSLGALVFDYLKPNEIFQNVLVPIELKLN